ncbi:hypothetical protein D3C79_986920 [compost metagenome]
MPSAEADLHVELHRHEAFEPVGHGRFFHPQEVFDEGIGQLIGGLQGRLVLAEEHRRIEFEVVIVAAVQGVEIDRALLSQVQAVGLDCPVIGDHGPAVIATEQVDVRRHMA